MHAGKGAEEVPAAIDLFATAASVFQLVARPKDGSLRAAVESLRIEHRPLIVIAQQAHAATLDHFVEAFARAGAIADDVSQTEDIVNFLFGDVRKHALQSFKVAVDVTDYRASHCGNDPSLGEQTNQEKMAGCPAES
jgi:hypothetical protein